MAKIMGMWGGLGNGAGKRESLSAISVRNGASSGDDRLTTISQNFRKIQANPQVSKMAPFCKLITVKDCRNMSKITDPGGGWGNGAKNGNPYPRLWG